MKKILFYFLYLTLINASFLFAHELSFVQPISVDLDLVVAIPDVFDLAEQPYTMQEWSKLSKNKQAHHTQCHYVLENNGQYEMITIEGYNGSWHWRYNVANVLNKIVEGKRKDEKNITILESTIQHRDRFSEGSFAISYINKSQQTVVLFGKYFSRRFGCAGIQYEITLQSNQDKNEALRKIKEFMGRNLGFLDRTE